MRSPALVLRHPENATGVQISNCWMPHTPRTPTRVPRLDGPFGRDCSVAHQSDAELYPYTCARGVLEACSTAIWLMDDRITYKKRIERSLNLRLDDVRSQGKFRDKVERQSQGRRDEWLSQNPRQRAQERIDHFRACAKGAKVREKCKGGRFIAFGSGMPRISDRIRMSLDAEVDYSILSSVAHANTAVLPQLSGSLRPTDKGLLLKPGLSPLMAIWLIRNVVQWQSRAAWGCFRLFGRPLDGVTELLETTYERLGIEPERRFWTTGPDSDTAQT